MKNRLHTAILLLSAGIFINNCAQASSTEIHFSGRVKLGSCTVDTGSKNSEVNLGKIPKSVFSAIGSQSVPKTFSIKLINCSAVNIASVSMTGTTDNDDNQFFAIQNIANAATGVAIKIWSKNSNQIQLPSGNQVDHTIPMGSSTIELEYYAAYIQTRSNVTTGIANSYVDYTIEYR